jgi:predicted DNA-binding transcriptional regulator AlpA
MAKTRVEDPRLLVPDQIYRKSEAGPYFGYKPTQLDEKIKTGEIPKPIPLSLSGRATGWLGQQIIDHHARLIEAAANATRRRS